MFCFGTYKALCHWGTHPALIIILLALHVHLREYSGCEGHSLAYGDHQRAGGKRGGPMNVKIRPVHHAICWCSEVSNWTFSQAVVCDCRHFNNNFKLTIIEILVGIIQARFISFVLLQRTCRAFAVWKLFFFTPIQKENAMWVIGMPDISWIEKTSYSMWNYWFDASLEAKKIICTMILFLEF